MDISIQKQMMKSCIIASVEVFEEIRKEKARRKLELAANGSD